MASRNTHKSARGVQFDMETFVQGKTDAVALGNLGGSKATNARGDILGKGGKIEVERKEVVRKYYREPTPKVKTESIKKPLATAEIPQNVEFKSVEQAYKDLEAVAGPKKAVVPESSDIMDIINSTRKKKKGPDVDDNR